MVRHRRHFNAPRAVGLRATSRVGRGDVREALLLVLSDRAHNGYQLMKQIESLSGGAWRPSPGSVYPALAQLEAEGLVRRETLARGRAFNLTEAGKAWLKERDRRVPPPWQRVRQDREEATELTRLLERVYGAGLELERVGSPLQHRQAVLELARTVRALYLILSEDAGGDTDA